MTSLSMDQKSCRSLPKVQRRSSVAALVQPFESISQKRCLIVKSSRFDDSISSLSREPRVEAMLEIMIKHHFRPIGANGWTSAARTTNRQSQGSTKSFGSVLWTFGKLRHDLRSTERLPKPYQLSVQIEAPSFSTFVLIINMLNLATRLAWVKTGILIKCVVVSRTFPLPSFSITRSCFHGCVRAQ